MSNEVPERIFLRACHPANPNHNCTWSVSKESTQSVEYIRADLAAARVKQLEQSLTELIEWIDNRKFEQIHKYCGCTYCRTRETLRRNDGTN